MVKIKRNKDILREPVSHNDQYFKKVILKNDAIPGLLQFAKANFKSGDEVDEHFHESIYEVFYLISGAIRVIADEIEELAVSGDSIIIYPEQNHSFKFIKNTELIYFNLPGI